MSSEHYPDGTVRSVTTGYRTTVTLHGEFDIAVTPVLTAHLDDATAGPRPEVVVDLRTVTFIDCSTLGLLCRAGRRCRERDGTLTLICTDPRTLHLLGIAGLPQAVPLADLRSRP
ncbi:STAS domain-containing protein [Streptomyces sp. NPDC006733]|uniref:STAS domain-containing protein n=1 Tax=Streptomyces sp. NPDC006733 TaxID=3155460 RepID=UPI0033C90C0A